MRKYASISKILSQLSSGQQQTIVLLDFVDERIFTGRILSFERGKLHFRDCVLVFDPEISDIGEANLRRWKTHTNFLNS